MSPGRPPRAARLVPSALIAAALLGGALAPAAPRACQAIVFAAMLAALWGTGSRLCRWLVPDWVPPSRWVAAFTFAVGVAVVPATWMGHFGVLRPGPFLIWTAAAYLLSLLLPKRDVGAALVSASAKDGPTESTLSERIETALLIAAALAIGLVFLRELKGMRFLPPGSYDDLSYHLSAVATWIRHGDLRMIRFSMGDTSTPYYPILGEMSSWVLFAPFRDSDVAARWTQLPFALFSFLAAAAIARRLGLGRRDAALAAAAYAGIYHVFPFLAMGAGNDHSLSFFTLAAVDGSLAFARRPRAGAAAATGSALGLLLATKYIGVFFAPVLVAFLLLVCWIERRRAEAEPAGARPPATVLAVLLVAAMAATAGYTYLRNAVSTGNPIYPAPVRIFGVELLPGWANILERDTSPEYQIDTWHFLTRRARMFGHYFPFTLLPAALLAPLLALARRWWREALVFTLPAIFFLQFRFLMHDHRDIRYFLPGIALAAVAFAWLLARSGPRIFPFRAAFLVWIAWQEVRLFHRPNVWKLLVTLALLGIGALLEIGWRKWRTRAPELRSWGRRWGPAAAAALVAAAALPAGWMIAKYQAVKLAGEPAPLALERLAGPDGARVAYAGLNKPYFFFGSRLQNRLEIVPRSRALAARTYRWGSRMAEPYEVGPYRRWRGNLERLGIELVVLIRTPWSDPEASWLSHRSKDFRLVYRDAETEIWRVLPGEKAARKRGGADRPARRRRGPGAGSRPAAGSGPSSS